MLPFCESLSHLSCHKGDCTDPTLHIVPHEIVYSQQPAYPGRRHARQGLSLSVNILVCLFTVHVQVQAPAPAHGRVLYVCICFIHKHTVHGPVWTVLMH